MCVRAPCARLMCPSKSGLMNKHIVKPIVALDNLVFTESPQ